MLTVVDGAVKTVSVVSDVTPSTMNSCTYVPLSIQNLSKRLKFDRNLVPIPVICVEFATALAVPVPLTPLIMFSVEIVCVPVGEFSVTLLLATASTYEPAIASVSLPVTIA